MHIPHCWKSHVAAHLESILVALYYGFNNTYSVDINEMPHFVEFHLVLHCLLTSCFGAVVMNGLRMENEYMMVMSYLNTFKLWIRIISNFNP